MTTRKFLKCLALSLGFLPLATLTAPKPARNPNLQLRRLTIYRDSKFLVDQPFSVARPGDKIWIFNAADKTDPDIGEMLKVHEGPFRTKDPYTQGA